MNFLRPRKKDEDGMVMVTVVFLAVFVFSIVLIVASTTLVNVKLTSSSRTSYEALDAAEAGRDTLIATLTNDGTLCEPSGSTTTAPIYEWKVYYSEANTPPTKITDPGVQTGCPTREATTVLLHVKGTSRNEASTKTITTRLAWDGDLSFVPNTPFKTAVYSSGSGLTLNNFQVLSDILNTNPANVIVGEGSFACTGLINLFIGGSVNVRNGDAQVGGCGNIMGDLNVNGDITQSGLLPNLNVLNNVCATGRIIPGFLKRINITGPGHMNQRQATCPGFEKPSAWIDYNPLDPTVLNPTLNPAPVLEITDQDVCVNKTRPGAILTDILTMGKLADIIRGQSKDTVIDLTACTNGVKIKNALTLVATHNITLVANSFDVSGLVPGVTPLIIGGAHQLNFVIPDKVITDPTKAHCTSGQGDMSINGVTNVLSSSLFYTPCNVTKFSGNMIGQVYTGGGMTAGGSLVPGDILYHPIFPANTYESGGPGTVPNPKIGPTILSQSE